MAIRTGRRYFAAGDFHIMTYGCQMNVADSDLVSTILQRAGFAKAQDLKSASVIIFNTCSIRENAEAKVLRKIKELKDQKNHSLIGIIGCMAKRFNDTNRCSEHGINFVVSPDCYRELPKIVTQAAQAQSSMRLKGNMNSVLCTNFRCGESYNDIYPTLKELGTLSPKEKVNGYVSISRGCNNFCSYCVVPYTRGRETSRDPESIMAEVQEQVEKIGVKQITLLGQNVNSYKGQSPNAKQISFADLLATIAKAYPETRIRFTSPHPKDFPVDLLHTIASYENICKHIHLPLQSGSNSTLKRMRRNYTIEGYIDLVNQMRTIIKGVGISTDLICGFCGETREEFEDTMKAVSKIRFDSAYTFAFSMRENTLAQRTMRDDVSEQIKGERLVQLIELTNKIQQEEYQKEIGNTHVILAETVSKKSQTEIKGVTGNGKRCVVSDTVNKEKIPLGAYVKVKVNGVIGKTLRSIPIELFPEHTDKKFK